MGGIFSSSKEECRTNHPELIETREECRTKYPSTGGTTISSSGSSSAACSAITCNGTNRTKKSASEISAIPSSISSSEYSDATFRSPCCKWHNLPDPEQGKRRGINYTDFLNTQISCPITADGNTPWITAAINDGSLPRCGQFTINANADQSITPQGLLTNGQFPIHFIHDHPTNTGSCDFRCGCPQNEDGTFFVTQLNHWNETGANVGSQIRCHPRP